MSNEFLMRALLAEYFMIINTSLFKMTPKRVPEAVHSRVGQTYFRDSGVYTPHALVLSTATRLSEFASHRLSCC